MQSVGELKNLLQQYLREKNYKKIQEILDLIPVNDLSSVLQKLEATSLESLVNVFAKIFSYDVLRTISSRVRSMMINVLSIDNLKKVVNSYSNDQLFSVALSLDNAGKEKLFSVLSLKQQGAITLKMKFINCELGSIISLNYFVMPLYWTVKKAINYLSKNDLVNTGAYLLLTTNEKFEITGYIPTERLLIAKDPALLASIVNKHITAIKAHDASLKNISEIITKNDADFVVVTDSYNKLVGVVTASGIISYENSFKRTNDYSIECVKSGILKNCSEAFIAQFFGIVLVTICGICLYYSSDVEFILYNILPFVSILPLIASLCLTEFFEERMPMIREPKVFISGMLSGMVNAVIASVMSGVILWLLTNFKLGVTLSLTTFLTMMIVGLLTYCVVQMVSLEVLSKKCLNRKYLVTFISLIATLVMFTTCYLIG